MNPYIRPHRNPFKCGLNLQRRRGAIKFDGKGNGTKEYFSLNEKIIKF